MIISIIGGKCGCSFCMGRVDGNSRNFYKGLKNKHGRSWGTHPKGGRSRGKNRVITV